MAQETTSKQLSPGDGAPAAAKPLSGPSVPPPLPGTTASPKSSDGPPAPVPSPPPHPGDANAARRAAKRRPAGPSRGQIAANDDAPSIGGLIFALHQKPSRRPIVVATIASIVWSALGVLLGWAMLAPELQRVPTFMEMLARPTAITLAATIVIPIALFWLLALLVWRAQELKLMSSAMTEVAIRLAEPDRMAEQQIASVGQSVRRQVNHMNEAVSRALGRAGELEALVHNEVSSLERSYTQNENRIRGLLQELSGERHALLNTSERVNASLRELSTEIPALIDKLGDQQVKLAKFIEGAGQNVVALESTLNASTDRLAIQLDSSTDRLTTSLDTRTQQLTTVFETFSEGINTTLGERTEGLQTVLEEYTRALDATLEARQQSLDGQLVERTKALDDAFSERLKLFDDSILRSTIAIDSTVADKARALSTALESHAREIGHVLTSQAGQLDEQLMHGVNAVRRASENVTRQSIKAIEGLAGQADLLKNVSENLVNQISGVTNRFDQQGQTIMRAANALETANFRIDKTLQNRQVELSQTLDQISDKAESVDRMLRAYPESLEGTFNEVETRARAVGEHLTRGAEERSRLALTEMEQLQQSVHGESERALAGLRTQFSSISREVNDGIGSLSTRFSQTSEDMRREAQRTMSEIDQEQLRLKEQLDRLPDVTRSSAAAMRQSLQEQLRAVEQLSQLTTRTDVSPPMQRPAASAPNPGVTSRSISSLTQSLANEIAGQQGRYTSADTAGPMPPSQPPAARNMPVPVQSGAAVAAAQEAAREGWSLGDLLARASQDEETPSSGFNIANISRALDQTTASAIWSRFRVGQRGVMVRSIYSADGRAAFDEIQNRYKTDSGLRQTVDRYLANFQNLLREADQRDPSGRLAQSYIVQDSGRVYLFLAHASGQLV